MLTSVGALVGLKNAILFITMANGAVWTTDNMPMLIQCWYFQKHNNRVLLGQIYIVCADYTRDDLVGLQ